MTRPADSDGADGAPALPVFEAATHLPGHARVSFSPLQFYALSRVERLDVDASAEGLWLTEVPCPEVTETGIAFFSRKFTHEHIQPFITGLPNAPQRDLVIRYNRALLARGVLKEVILCERLPGGHIVERLRCRDRECVMAERDANAALRERQRFVAVLRAKITQAEEDRLTLAHGDAALERFRDDQAERTRRQRRERNAPMAAKPIRAHSRSDAATRDAAAKVHAIADHLAGGRAVEAFDAQDADTEATPSGPERVGGAPRSASGGRRPQDEATGGARGSPTRAAGQTRRKPATRTTTGQRTKSHTLTRGPADADGPTASVPKRSDRRACDHPSRSGEVESVPTGGALPSAPISLVEALGGRTGFLTDDDE